MSKKIEELKALRARAMAATREQVKEDGTVNDQGIFDKATLDFANLTKQIQTETEMEALESLNNTIGVDEKDVANSGFLNYMRTGTIENGMSTGTGSAGYLVPDELRKEIIKKAYEVSDMLNIADVFETESLQNIPVEGTGATMYWVSEEGKFTDSSPTMSRVQIGAYKGGVLVKVSEELLLDSSFNVESYITEKGGVAIGQGFDEAFIANTVSDRPTGFMASAAFGLTSSVTASFSYDDLTKLRTSVKTMYGKQGSWMMSSEALAAVMSLKDPANRYVYQPAPNSDLPDLLINKPVYASDSMAALASSAKPVAFGDFKYYKIGLRGPLYIQRLNELYSENGLVGFRLYQRADGKLSLAESIKYLALK